MQIVEQRNGTEVDLTVTGRVDVNTVNQFESQITQVLSLFVTKKLVIDFSGVDYISSAGIRVLLSTQKKMKEGRQMIIKNPGPFCKQVFEVTGADIFLNIA